MSPPLSLPLPLPPFSLALFAAASFLDSDLGADGGLSLLATENCEGARFSDRGREEETVCYIQRVNIYIQARAHTRNHGNNPTTVSQNTRHSTTTHTTSGQLN